MTGRTTRSPGGSVAPAAAYIDAPPTTSWFAMSPNTNTRFDARISLLPGMPSAMVVRVPVRYWLSAALPFTAIGVKKVRTVPSPDPVTLVGVTGWW